MTTDADLPPDYLNRVYAGVLGKIIGVYLGRPFEQWSYPDIMAKLGEIDGYVNEKLKAPLVVTDDDISGTFTFIRSIEDNDFPANLTAADIGRTWLNYLIRNKTVLWWGGMGMSTEHTAYNRLIAGIEARRSGSIELNGPVVAEQIGAQIFIDGWGLINPSDPDRAAAMARAAGSVSHDREAVHGGQIVASPVAQAAATVIVSIAGAVSRTIASETGEFVAELLPLPPGGPHMLEVSSGGARIVLSNVLIGDVWVCSGQSKMEWAVRDSDHPARELADVDLPLVRLLNVP